MAVEWHGDEITQAIERGAERGLERGATLLVGYVKESKLSGQVLGNVTGRLRRSINQRKKDRFTQEVGTDVEYAAIHEFGGEIRPKTAKKLHFKIDGKDIFADKVRIPARPYLRPSLPEKQADIENEIAKAIRSEVGFTGVDQ